MAAYQIGLPSRIMDAVLPAGIEGAVGYGDFIGYAKMVVSDTVVPLLGLPLDAAVAVLKRIDTNSGGLYVSMSSGITPSSSPVAGMPLASGDVMTIVGRSVIPPTATPITAPTSYSRVNDRSFTATKASTDLRNTFPPNSWLRIVEATTGQDTVAEIVSSTWDGTDNTTVLLDRDSVLGTPAQTYILSGTPSSSSLADVRLVGVSASTATIVAHYFGVYR